MKNGQHAPTRGACTRGTCRRGACHCLPSIDHLITRVSAGDLDAVRDALVDEPGDDPIVALLDAEIRLRSFATTTPDLVALRGRMARDEPAGGPRAAWAAAILAEHLLINGDPMAFLVAVSTLDALPPEALPDLSAAYTRARLLRIRSVAWVVLPEPGDLSAYQQMYSEATALLLRYGLVAEVTATTGMTAAILALTLLDDPFGHYGALRESRAAFGEDHPSLWPTVLDYHLAHLAMLVGELDVAEAAVRRLERADPPGRMGRFPLQCRAALVLLADGPTPGALAAARRAVAATHDDPWMRAAFQRLVADRLLDDAHPDAATFGRAGLALPPLEPIEAIDHQILAARLALLEGHRLDLDDLFHPLDTLVRAGRTRVAAGQALKLAHDLARAGQPAVGDTLWHWGIDRLPPAARRLPFETVAARPLGGSAPAPDAPGPTGSPAGSTAHRLDIGVLVPRLDLRIGGGPPLALGLRETTLVVVLVHAHPEPLSIDAAHRALWPGRATDRPRLNTVVHRLRQRLGPAAGAVVRTGPTLALDDRCCRADLWDYRQRLAAAGADRIGALASVRGNLCDAELPDVAHLVEQRRRLALIWRHHARAALADGSARPADLAAAATALGVDLTGATSEPATPS